MKSQAAFIDTAVMSEASCTLLKALDNDAVGLVGLTLEELYARLSQHDAPDSSNSSEDIDSKFRVEGMAECDSKKTLIALFMGSKSNHSRGVYVSGKLVANFAANSKTL